MSATELLQASARMAASARAGDWDSVALHQAERSRLLEAVSLDDPAMADTIRVLLQDNEETFRLVGAARDMAGEALGQHQHRHRALHSYLKASLD